MQSANNYTYDKIGNLTGDAQSNVHQVDWTVYGKIRDMLNPNGHLIYAYDPAGQRASKTLGTLTTFYVRDASGNPLAVYDNNGGAINWKEQHLYGSSRLGMWQPNMALSANNAGTIWATTGHKQYELTNHLGNVIATIAADQRNTVQNGANPVYYTPPIQTAQDYYAFGSEMPGRVYNNANYRYGFNGKENDNDVGKGTGNQQDYGMRIYDPRVGRFLSVDPLTKNYPWYTPYQFAGNTPIQAVDMDGAEPKDVNTGKTITIPSGAALRTMKNTDSRFWNDLFKFEKTYSFKDIIDDNANIHRQEMDKASGSQVNEDIYSVTITKLPPGMTEHQLFDHIKKDFNDFMDYSVATFGAEDPSSKKIWNSVNPTGAVMKFHNSKDDAGVVTSKAGSDYWVFTPVWTSSDWRHPLAGHREFGLTNNGNNTFTFYTRGVDRMWTTQDAIYNYMGFNPVNLFKGDQGNFFKQAGQLWNAVMDNAVKYINDNGGSASKTTSFSRRIPWTDVKTN